MALGNAAHLTKPEGSLAHALQDLRHRERAHVARGELDRERQTVQEPAELSRADRVFITQRKVGTTRARAAFEEGDRFAPARRAGIGIRRRQLESRQIEHLLLDQIERLAAGREDSEPRALRSCPRRPLRRPLDHVLAVVEEQERSLGRERATERFAQRRRARDIAHAEHAGDQGLDLVLRRERGQIDEPDAIRETLRGEPRRLDRDPRLAATARPRDRDQARRRHRVEHGLKRGGASDERGGSVR